MSTYQSEEAPKKSNRTKWLIGCGVGAIILVCVGLLIIIGGFAGLKAWMAGEDQALRVDVQAPTSDINEGDPFTISITLANEGTKNITIDGIMLPNEIFTIATLTATDPPILQSTAVGDQTQYTLDWLIAPYGERTISFTYEALQAGRIDRELKVLFGENTILSPITFSVNPATVVQDIVVEPTPELELGEVIPFRSVVQIIAMIDMEGEHTRGWSGSGTIISEDGLILTNAHVVLSDRYYSVVDLVVSLTQEQDQPPVPTFYADVIQADANLDLAVIKLRSDLDGGPVTFSDLGIQPVPLGDSSSLELGDPLTIIGYPGIGGETITLTTGEVSGFTFQESYGNRAFIKTSATIAGGNSGGLAATTQGEIIGVPTKVGSGDVSGVFVDCRRLVDTNRDGIIDEKDSCVPTGGFINALRPIQLALPLIEAAKAGEVLIVENIPQPEQEEDEPEGDIILIDEFNDNANNWEVGEFEGAYIEITNGLLVMDVTEESLWAYSALEDSYDSVILGVDISVLFPASDGDYGFICGYQDEGHFTALEISEDGYYTIWTYDQNEFITLVEWTYSDIIPAEGTNTLSVYCGPDRLALGVNGMRLVETVHPNFTGGMVGLITGTYENPNLTVGFDNFMIIRP